MRDACLMRRRAFSRVGGDESLGMRIGSKTIASTIWSPSDLLRLVASPVITEYVGGRCPPRLPCERNQARLSFVRSTLPWFLSIPMQSAPFSNASPKIVPEPQKGSSRTLPFETPEMLTSRRASREDSEIPDVTYGLSVDLSLNPSVSGM